VSGRDTGCRVLLADDHVVARAGVRTDLDRGGYRICAEASDAESAVEAALRELPDVCLLDVRMPGDGLVAAREIMRQLPKMRIVMLSVSHDADDIAKAIDAGAVGYVYKDSDTAVLTEAIEAVVVGGLAFPGRP
jgi:two-component system, NarL family, nitrate/nitrite response regulator NarL